MGQELDCTMQYRGRTCAGRAHLETDFLLFRGDERLKVLFKDLKAVRAAGGRLQLEFAGGPASFDLGKAAEKWADKILHPPSRLDKLGVKDGVAVGLVGDFEPDFLRELKDRGAAVAASKDKPALVCFATKRSADLGRLAKLAGSIPPKGALWVIYPKGVTAIREIEVIGAGRAAGLKDVKVAAFSATHTGLKFVK
jgi:hypothetical protein